MSNPEIYKQVVQSLDDIDNFNFKAGSSVIGLMCLHKELDFFGCLKCENMVSSRENIPAKCIAGDCDEDDLFTSLEVYMDRPLFIVDTLNRLFELCRDNAISNRLYGGMLAMNCMCKYLDNSRIQVSGSASLFFILRQLKDENKSVPHFFLRRLVETVINAMEEHIDESPVGSAGFLRIFFRIFSK